MRDYVLVALFILGGTVIVTLAVVLVLHGLRIALL